MASVNRRPEKAVSVFVCEPGQCSKIELFGGKMEQFNDIDHTMSVSHW